MTDPDYNNQLPEQSKPSPAQIEELYRDLFRTAQENSRHTVAESAAHLGLSVRAYQRLLNGPSSFTFKQVNQIAQFLNIDKSRAAIAINNFNDCDIYNDQTLIIATDVLVPLVNYINHNYPRGCQELHPYATNQLVEWIADKIIQHQSYMSKQQQVMDKLRAND